MDAYVLRTRPDPYAPFNISQAFRVENMIYMSGQVAINLEGEVVGAGDMTAQATQAFDNIRAVLADAGSDFTRIVKMTVYVTDMANINDYSAVRTPLFAAPPPAETLVQVAALALPELLIEIDAMAMVEGIRRPALP